MRSRTFFALALAGALMAPARPAAAQAASPPAEAYTVVTRQGRQPLPVRRLNDQDLVALDDLGALFPLTVREDALAGGLTISAGGGDRKH